MYKIEIHESQCHASASIPDFGDYVAGINAYYLQKRRDKAALLRDALRIEEGVRAKDLARLTKDALALIVASVAGNAGSLDALRGDTRAA